MGRGVLHPDGRLEGDALPGIGPAEEVSRDDGLTEGAEGEELPREVPGDTVPDIPERPLGRRPYAKATLIGGLVVSPPEGHHKGWLAEDPVERAETVRHLELDMRAIRPWDRRGFGT